MWVAFANAKATHILFSKNISIYVVQSNLVISTRLFRITAYLEVKIWSLF